MLSGLDHDILVKSRAFLSYFCDQPTEILKSGELKTRHFQQGKKAFGHSAARLLNAKFNRLKCCRILEF